MASLHGLPRVGVDEREDVRKRQSACFVLPVPPGGSLI
jgi:hypothetical protein